MLTKKKSTNYLVPLIFAITLLRIYSFVPCEKHFFSYEELALLDTPRFFASIGVAAIFSLLSALLVSCIVKMKKTVSLLTAIFIADPLFFILQENIATVIISSLFLVCIFVFLKTENLLLHGVLFGIYTFVGATFIPETIYSTIPLLLALIIIKHYGNFGNQKIKAVVSVVLTTIALVASFFLNDSYKKDLFLINKFFNGINSYTYNEPYLIIIFSVLILLLSLLVLCKLISFAGNMQKNKKNNQLAQSAESSLWAAGVLIVLLFALQVFALFSEVNNPSFIALNIGAPLILLFAVTKYGNFFDDAFQKLNAHLKENFKIYFPIFVLFCLIYLRVLNSYCSLNNIIYYATLYLT